MMTRHLDDPTAFAERVAEVAAQERENPTLTWWLSFADGKRPKGEQFLGVVIVDGCHGIVHARMEMTFHGVSSPGGEIQGFGFDPTMGPPDQVTALAKLPRLTLLSKDDLEAAGMELDHP
jgi:hypothetical protein